MTQSDWVPQRVDDMASDLKDYLLPGFHIHETSREIRITYSSYTIGIETRCEWTKGVFSIRTTGMVVTIENVSHQTIY